MTIFNAVCFVVLMDHHREGVEEAHPNYIKEKLEVFENCSEITAYTMLDQRNQDRVADWCSKWDVEIAHY